jgi:hypothetical protein
MDKNVIWAWAIKNSIAMLAWTALAIVFNKWWIALFALLFMSGLKTGYKSYRVCDKCGKYSPYADSYNDALSKAIEAGWVHVADGNRDYCPDCANKLLV